MQVLCLHYQLFILKCVSLNFVSHLICFTVCSDNTDVQAEQFECDESEDECVAKQQNTSQNTRRKRKRPTKPQSQSLPIATGNWKTGNEADKAPQRRRFTPNRDEGFQLPQTGQSWSKGDLFLLFISMKSIETIVLNKNAYAEMLKTKRKSFRWFPLTAKSSWHLWPSFSLWAWWKCQS